jgi:hypothetical protein
LLVVKHKAGTIVHIKPSFVKEVHIKPSFVKEVHIKPPFEKEGFPLFVKKLVPFYPDTRVEPYKIV